MTKIVVPQPIGDGCVEDFHGYLKQHELSISCANQTIKELGKELNAWHRYIHLFRESLIGEHVFEVEGEVQGHLNLVARLEVGALSTSKAALDCCLGGLYVQSAMLTRHLLETWQRIAYSCLNPLTAYRWLATPERPAKPPNQGTINRGLLKSPAHKRAALQVERAIDELDNMAHPTYKTLTAHDTDNDGFISLGGYFSFDRARAVMIQATIAQMLILQEHKRYMPHTEEWKHAFLGAITALQDCYPDMNIEIRQRDE